MVNPTARETTQATSPIPSPITVLSSSVSVVACAARGAIAVAKATRAAALGCMTLAGSWDILLMAMVVALKAGRATDAGAKAAAQAMTTAIRMTWNDFMVV